MSEWLAWSVDMAWKATIVMCLATLVTHLMRRRAAAERHAVWLTAVLCVLLLPLMAAVFPAWTLNVPILSSSVGDVVTPYPPPSPALPAPDAPAPPPAASSITPMPAPVAPPAPVPPAGPRAPLRSSLLFVWLLGTAGVVVQMVIGHARVRRMALHAVPQQDDGLLLRASNIARSLGVTRRVRMLEGDDDVMPLTFGVVRPALLLPSSAARWTALRQDAVLRHELAHVRRRDSLTQLLAGVACALHWYNPLVWYAAHRMCVEREHACDDAVLAAGSRATDYAAELLDIARGLRVQRNTAIAAIAMARPSQLRTRLAAVLEDRRRTERASRRLMVPVWIGAIALLTPLSSVAPMLMERDAPASTKTKHDKPGSRAAALTPPSMMQSPASAGLMLAPAAPLTFQERCLSGDNSMVNSNSNDDRRTIKWSGSGCSGEVIVEGDVQFDAEFRRLTGLSHNGYFRLTTDENRRERRVVVRPSGNGLTYEYSVDGNRREFDAEGQAWLDQSLLMMFRRLGFMAEERATAMLQRGGPEAVIEEAARLEGDYMRAAYLGVLVEKGNLDESTLRRVLEGAGSTIESDHYITSIVTRVAGNYRMTDGVRNAYIEALRNVDSDHYRYTAFNKLLGEGELSAAQMSAVLRQSREIESDHYRAQLLTELNAKYGMTPDIRAAYLEAAAGLDSDHYKAEVLSKLMDEGDLGAADLSRLAEAAATIDSDHYRAAVLETFTEARTLDDPTMQRAFVRAAAGIESDHYLQALLSHLTARDRVTETTLNMILEAAASIEGDHYRSTLLTEIANTHRLEGETRARFVRLMDTIESETYRGRVASALLRRSR